MGHLIFTDLFTFWDLKQNILQAFLKTILPVTTLGIRSLTSVLVGLREIDKGSYFEVSSPVPKSFNDAIS